MTNPTQPEKSTGHGGFESRDIGTGPVLYFLAGLAVLGVITYFLVDGIYRYLENQSEAQQAPVSPLVTSAAKDTRHLPPEYNGDYDKYLQRNFPSPQLETDERDQLDTIRLHEAETLSTYDWIDQKAGTVRIPIERAMELTVQRGLPVRAQESGQSASNSGKKVKGTP